MEIIVLACLVADPSQCKDQRLPDLVDTDNPFRCSFLSMPYVAQWQGENPKWIVKKWRCGSPGARDM
ncbi:MAG: hypothetical protein NW215_13285 [Hyphomicrobiales bacterium]|nr:hypothetical protein [Hyphomicrobiales bacterium]